MRRLERENESLRHAIENYRDLERRRAAGGSGGPGGAGQDAKGQEETAEDGEEDEVEKAVEVSPSGVFLKFSEEIGRGSFKAVYKGLDTTTGVFVAWCELQLSGNRLSKKERDRFREEAGLMKGLTHPNIVRFYDFWEVDKPKRSCIVLVTELMTSGTLRTYLKNFGQKRVSLKIIKQWCRQILRGLQFLHSRNPPIIHRDLKCDNIFISGTTGQVKVGDLGLATLKNRSFAKSVIGTPEFMAPEVYEEHYDEAVDVYAFGMCMLEMVTSEYPYSECTGPAQIYKKVITGIKPSSFDKIDDPQTRDLIEWCTRLNSKERPTVKQLLNHEFFAEDCGMRLEVANREEAMNSGSSVIHLQLRVLDAKKRKDTHKENEAIQFNYVLNKDNPEETAKQMLMSGLLAEENCRPLAKMITNVIQSLVRAREERRRDQVPQTQSAPAAGPPGAAAGPGASLVPTAAAPAPVPLHLSVSLPVISSSQSVQPAAAHVHTATAVLSAAPGAPLASVAAAAPVTVTVAATQTQPSHQPVGTETAPAETRQAELPPPAAPTEPAAGAQPQHGQTEAHSDSATGAESDSALGERKEKKNRARRRKTCERLPRLTVLEVKNSDNGPVVSCLLETNQSQAITFKFDLHEADVTAISHKMTEAQLLPKDDAQYFEEQLRAVVRRQRELRSTGANQPPPPPHADEDTHPAQSAEDPAGDVSTPVSGSGSSAGGSPRPRPTELAPPPPPSGQVAERAVPVLVRAPHGLQIVTLTTQQAAALLRQSQAAAALLAPRGHARVGSINGFYTELTYRGSYITNYLTTSDVLPFVLRHVFTHYNSIICSILSAGATGRRSRFIVSSVVESKASPMPSPCLLSPASEQPLNILTSAGSATTSVSPSPQVALISPEPLSPPPVSSALHSPQDPAPTALSPMGNLAQLAKQLNRLTSQPGEAAGSGTQTPSDGAPTARRLTATGAGPTPTQRSGADGGGGTPSPSQQTVPLQPAGTGVSATGSPADLSRSASGTDAASATGSEARRKQVPLHLTDLAKKLDKLRVKPPGGAAVASAAAGTASTAVQTTTPLDDASKPLAVGGAQPVATPSGPPPETARVQPNVNQMDVQAATPAVNGTASDVSPEGGSRPVRRGRFAISKATTAAQPPAPAPAPAAAPAPSAAQTPSPVNSVEEMAMYRELIAR
ncbi:Serine/threonine-protein kinase WNK3 [Amphibalanus amphitrite]|uniref:non-specific serine/threonine protein kinase n=1 Tax=Amphibalanus amphitrite TaxID=1232801 RepID=A0A6A4W3J5_AMPAM|nr:Serine/threonine-protein kinase WNK3 [Amphibalanus amphitrite]